MDASSEWSKFEDDSRLDRSRVGAPIEPMVGSSTAIGVGKSTPGIGDG